MIERDLAAMMMQYMGINSTMKQMAPNETKISIDSRRRTTEEREAARRVIRECKVRMVEIRDRHYHTSALIHNPNSPIHATNNYISTKHSKTYKSSD
jgi:hypothetical protein